MLWLAMVPVLYVLSVGPVAAINQKTGFLPREYFMGFYAPLSWSYRNTPMKAPLDWYLGLWGAH